ncbi:MAG: COX15/CtaA family protein [Solirubrobacterales bacterium]
MDGVSGPSGGVAAGARVGGGGDELGRFRRLSDLTAVAILLLVVIGGIVRVSESGLGCGPAGSGTEGWPLCGGAVIPLVGDESRLIEFSHRVLAAIVGVMIAVLVWRALRMRRPQTSPNLRQLRWPLRGAIAAGVLVLVQAALGGLTVENNLEDELVAAHLGLAMLLLGLILWLSVRARQEQAAALPAGTSPVQARSSRRLGFVRDAPVRGLKPFAVGAVGLLLCAIVAGGYVAGTEEEGVTGGAANGAHLACGESFPTCLDGRLLPFGESRLTDIHLTHRVFVYAATAAILALLGLALARGSRSRLLLAAALLLVAQLLLGALNVWLGEHAALVVAHLTVATLLWSSVLLIAYRLAWAPAPAAARPPAGRTEAVAVAR